MKKQKILRIQLKKNSVFNSNPSKSAVHTPEQNHPLYRQTDKAELVQKAHRLAKPNLFYSLISTITEPRYIKQKI